MTALAMRAGRGAVVAAGTAVTAGLVAFVVASGRNDPVAESAAPIVDAARVAALDESFGFLQAVREMPDGRVLVADPLGGVLALVDMTTGTMEPVGREGAGPGEWRQPDAVYPLPGDSTLLVDLGNARLSVLDPAGTFVHSYPMALTPSQPAGTPGGPGAGSPGPGPGPGALDILNPRTTDGAGRIYYQARPRQAGPPGSAQGGGQDSAEVRRWDRGTAEPVRLAGLRPAATRTSSSGTANQTQVMTRSVPLSPQDDWAVGQDGRVALVRAEPYRVEWIGADGAVISGPAIDYAPTAVGAAEKERWLEAMGSTGLAVSMTVQNGETSMQMRRGGGRAPVAAQSDDYEWPDVLPAFRTGGARVDPRGRLWVERYEPVGAPVLYDVFDDDGIRSLQVRLPAGRRIVGFGSAVLFAVRTDDYGLQWLESYELPR